MYLWEQKADEVGQKGKTQYKCASLERTLASSLYVHVFYTHAENTTHGAQQECEVAQV